MQSPYPALAGQGLHVTPQRDGGDAEFGREFGDAQAAALADECEHPFMALVDMESQGSPLKAVLVAVTLCRGSYRPSRLS